MRLTARKAVEITRELWAWLAETGTPNKTAWPGWEKYGEMVNDCPLCQYAKQHSPKGVDQCPACPLYNRWEGKERCTKEGTPWWDWCEAGDPEARKAASLRMVTLCDKWLEEHTTESKEGC